MKQLVLDLRSYFCRDMNHRIYMQRCLQLAKNGHGTVSPNPMVGCVIVHGNRIIGEGWHRKAGEPHAEVNAIRSVKNRSLLKEAVLFVNLEPCAHHGKTPPCANLIVEKEIPKVVIGCRDPFSLVNGQGIEKLITAGTEVIEGVLQEESLWLNRRFFTFHREKRPYIILKWAQTTDGFLDRPRLPHEKGINWISGKEAKILVHKWRSEEDAILVGTNTVINDDPVLTVRETAGKNPVRLLLDAHLTAPENSQLFNQDATTFIFNGKTDAVRRNLHFIKTQAEEDLIDQVLKHCYTRDIQSVLVEGGAFTLQHFLNRNLWDEARVLIGKSLFGHGLKAPSLPPGPFLTETIGDDKLLIFKNV